MSKSLKAAKPRMYSTYYQVINVLKEISTEVINISSDPNNIVKMAGQIECEIVKADSIITAALNSIYSVNNLRTTPWTTPVVPDPNNDGDMTLVGISTGSDIANAYTATWIVEFTSTEDFTLTSSLEGAQGTFTISSDAASTNNDIIIGSNAWIAGDASPVDGDKYYFSVIDSQPLINYISARLAAGFVLESIFTSETPNENASSKTLKDEATYWLEKLQRPNDETGARLTSYSVEDIESLHVDYHITDYGVDDSSYSETTPYRSGVGSEI